MGVEADDLFLDVTALGQQRGLLQDAVLVGMGADQLLHPGLHFLQVSAGDGAPQFLDLAIGALQLGHALAQLALDAPAFLVAHGIEQASGFLQLGQHRRVQLLVGGLFGAAHGPRQPQDRVQIGLRRDAELLGRAAEGPDVPAHQFAVQGEAVAGDFLHAQDQLHVAARQVLLQETADLHLQRVGLSRHAQVKIEEAVVDRLERQREPQVLARLSFDTGERRHGANGHGLVVAADIYELQIIQPAVGPQAAK